MKNVTSETGTRLTDQHLEWRMGVATTNETNNEGLLKQNQWQIP
jgi:hypothetical protein